jgi:uroporphyrinogen-III synthase
MTGALRTRGAWRAGHPTRCPGAELCRLIEAVGGRPIEFPSMEIRPPRDPDGARELLRAPRDLVIFISRNAVVMRSRCCLKQTPPIGESIGATIGAVNQSVLPGQPRPQLAAVGRATATAMEQAGLAPDLVPDSGFDSESLLALPALQRAGGKQVLIVRGEGGRALLGETLTQRGAEVVYAEVYRRAAPDTDARALLSDWRQSLGFVTATSDEVLVNLLAMVPMSAHRWLRALPLAVLSERNASGCPRPTRRRRRTCGPCSDRAPRRRCARPRP